MRVRVRLLAMFLAAASLLVGAAPPAGAAADLCPMGGLLVVAETDRDKALAWGTGRPRTGVSDAGAGEWSVLTLSTGDEGIAVLVAPGQVFFGVAGRGGETYPRDIELAFGPGFGKLREALGRTLADLAAAGVVRLEAADLQALAGLTGLGVLARGAGGWALTTRECQAVDLPASGL